MTEQGRSLARGSLADLPDDRRLVLRTWVKPSSEPTAHSSASTSLAHLSLSPARSLSALGLPGSSLLAGWLGWPARPQGRCLRLPLPALLHRSPASTCSSSRQATPCGVWPLPAPLTGLDRWQLKDAELHLWHQLLSLHWKDKDARTRLRGPGCEDPAAR
ncbi:uncharacterized protein LOC116421754 [Sarcophilus harrisii]|uniref:uncharacterized protein LOC116421754 n=1 Tax=Sarcophilus harrisii TaxID=9305 RepID=UPI00130203BE|nr:uncharacterized protein LOC116421754 [Sarcophilus harrisii]